MLLTLALAVAPPVLACGYHSSSEVALVLLNWAYPNALYVRTAVWQAENAGILPPRPRLAAKDLTAYQRVAAALTSLGQKVNESAGHLTDPPGMSIVMIDTLLWTRFTPTPDSYSAQIHAEGPSTGDVVVITASTVINAIVGSRLTVQAAEENGLVRYYGDAGKIALLQRLLHRGRFEPQVHAADAINASH